MEFSHLTRLPYRSTFPMSNTQQLLAVLGLVIVAIAVSGGAYAYLAVMFKRPTRLI